MEEEIIYFYNVKDGKYYQSRYTHRWLNNLQQQCKKQKEVIDKATGIINDYLKEDYSIYTENEIEVDLIVKLRNILKEVSE